MASIITLQGTVNWGTSFVYFKPLNIGTANEPSITNANTILQTILGPPFRWNWNRSTVNVTTIAGTQDYATSVPTFGFIESASATISGSTFAIKEVKQDLTVGTE